MPDSETGLSIFIETDYKNKFVIVDIDNYNYKSQGRIAWKYKNRYKKIRNAELWHGTVFYIERPFARSECRVMTWREIRDSEP